MVEKPKHYINIMNINYMNCLLSKTFLLIFLFKFDGMSNFFMPYVNWIFVFMAFKEVGLSNLFNSDFNSIKLKIKIE